MIERIATHKRTKEIINENSFLFKKRFGQNFLVDTNIINKIIEGSEITEDDLVIEIGTGIGSLTQGLLENAKQVIGIEIDKNLIPIVNETLKDYDNLTLINEDILKVDIAQVIKDAGFTSAKVVANLPYYITTPIIMNLLEQDLPIDSITVMVQKEVGHRMSAKNNTKEYGSLSVIVQYYCNATLVTNVPESCFMPKPNVTSCVINLKKHDEKPITVSDEKEFFAFVKMAFSQRRKTLVNCIFSSNKYDLSKVELGKLLEDNGFNPLLRGESLTIFELAEIFELLQ